MATLLSHKANNLCVQPGIRCLGGARPSLTLGASPRTGAARSRRSCGGGTRRLREVLVPRTVQDLVAGAQTVDESPEKASQGAGFSWTKQWYPIGVVKDLNRDRPHPVTVLGGRFVLWADSTGQWHVQDDACPHRFAAMSEGKIVGDALQCSYHGWKFDGAGNCTHIPQAPASQQRAACSNKWARLRSYPVKEVYGMVWMWPDAGEARWIEAEVQQVAQMLPPEEGGSEGWITFLPTYAREFPYSMQTLFDNVLDPAHAPWSHHGVIGNRDKATPLDMEVVQDVSPNGISVRYTTTNEQATGRTTFVDGVVTQEVTLSFMAPHTMVYDTKRQDGSRQLLMAYVTPTSPGKCRPFGISLDNQQTLSTLMTKHLTPEWVAHMVFMEAGDGDSALLMAQEQLLPQVPRGWHDFYLPTSADTCVRLWRRWLEAHTGPGSHPYMLAEMPPIPTVGGAQQAGRDRAGRGGAAQAGGEAQVTAAAGSDGGAGNYGMGAAAGGNTEMAQLKKIALDRWSSHVSTCTSCQAAMRAFARLKVTAWVAAAASAQAALLSLAGMWPAATSGFGLAPGGTVSIAGLSLPATGIVAAAFAVAVAVCVKLAGWAQEMHQSFIFKDYIHAYR